MFTDWQAWLSSNHPLGFNAAIGADNNGTVALAFRGVNPLGDIHRHGKTPGKAVSLLVSPLSHSVKLIEREEVRWSGRRDSNPRPSAPKADALPGCATPRRSSSIVSRIELAYIFGKASGQRSEPRGPVEWQKVHQAGPVNGYAIDATIVKVMAAIVQRQNA